MKNEIPKLAVISKCTVKTDTGAGELGKQYFKLIANIEKPGELILYIKKLVLSDRIELYRDFTELRKFKDKILFAQNFSIRTSTFEKAQELLEQNSIFR